jgi:hypothetical protein
MTEDEAAAEARERNVALGRRSVTDRFWMAVETAPGSWKPELQIDPPDRRPRWRRLLEALLDSPPLP